MAITNGYCTLPEIKSWCGIADAQDDAKLELAVESISRMIDDVCERQFFITTNETRWYRAESDGKSLYVDDLLSISELRTDDNGDGIYEILWDATWYRLEPRNAAPLGKPYRWVEVMPYSPRRFPNWWDTQITGSYGVPANSPWMTLVKQATLVQTHRMFKRKDSPFGVAGANDFGQLIMLRPKLDPDVELLLAPCRRDKEILGV